jgi:hypothetical protein
VETSAIAAFCEDLRRAREFNRLSLIEIAETTRVSFEYLEALENGAWDLIPSAYIQGYLGLYATAVGMNREKVMKNYRELTTREVNAVGAVVEPNAPLVKQPEKVGVTRAKVSVSWLAQLSMNRSAAYLLMIVVIVFLVGLISWSRSVVEPDIVLVPVRTSLIEYAQRTHGAYRILPLNLAGSSNAIDRSVGSWIQLLCNESGRLLIKRPEDLNSDQVVFSRFDTLVIQYLSGISLRVTPPHCALLLQTGVILSPTNPLRSDTAVYILPDGNKLNTAPVLTVSEPESTVDSAR